MKFHTVFRAAMAACLFTFAGSGDAAEPGPDFRSFTGSNGKIIEAVLISRDDEKETATLLLKNGNRATIPFTSLSEEDRTYVAAWDQAKAVFLQQCRGLTIRQLLELRGYESIKYDLEGNAIFFDGTLNGKPARFQVDTGAGTTLLNLTSAKERECEVGPMDQKIYGVSGEAEAGFAEVPSMAFGESEFRDQKILASDLAKDLPGNAEAKHDVLLGAEYLIRLETVISYKERLIFFRPDQSDKATTEGDEESLSFRIFKKKDGSTVRGKVVSKTESAIKLEQTDGKNVTVPFYQLSPEDAEYAFQWSEEKAVFMQSCRSLTVEELLDLRQYQSFVYQRRGNHIYVDGTLNDNKVAWLIDTGADNSLLHLHFATKYGCGIGPMDKKVYGIGGFAPAAAATIDKITMGSAVLTNRILLATDLARFQPDEELDYVGLFGADYMRELNAVITYRESRIFLKQ